MSVIDEIEEYNSFTEGDHSYCESCHSDLFFHCEQCEEYCTVITSLILLI
jgi:hypothetical protein